MQANGSLSSSGHEAPLDLWVAFHAFVAVTRAARRCPVSFTPDVRLRPLEAALAWWDSREEDGAW